VLLCGVGLMVVYVVLGLWLSGAAALSNIARMLLVWSGCLPCCCWFFSFSCFLLVGLVLGLVFVLGCCDLCGRWSLRGWCCGVLWLFAGVVVVAPVVVGAVWSSLTSLVSVVGCCVSGWLGLSSGVVARRVFVWAAAVCGIAVVVGVGVVVLSLVCPGLVLVCSLWGSRVLGAAVRLLSLLLCCGPGCCCGLVVVGFPGLGCAGCGLLLGARPVGAVAWPASGIWVISYIKKCVSLILYQ
jgi:hypothetical protein